MSITDIQEITNYKIKRMGNMELVSIHYKSDNLKIHGYILKPTNITRKLPVIVYCKEGINYDEITPKNLLDNKLLIRLVRENKFIVIMSNLRGSTHSEGTDEFGGSDLNDIINLYPVIKKYKYADESDISCYGVSRGVLMALLLSKRVKWVKRLILVSGIYDITLNTEYLINIRKIFKLTDKDIKKRSITDIPDKIPILFIHSQYDDRNPINGLYKYIQNIDNQHKIITYNDDNIFSKYKNNVFKNIYIWLLDEIKINIHDINILFACTANKTRYIVPKIIYSTLEDISQDLILTYGKLGKKIYDYIIKNKKYDDVVFKPKIALRRNVFDSDTYLSKYVDLFKDRNSKIFDKFSIPKKIKDNKLYIKLTANDGDRYMVYRKHLIKANLVKLADNIFGKDSLVSNDLDKLKRYIYYFLKNIYPDIKKFTYDTVDKILDNTYDHWEALGDIEVEFKNHTYGSINDKLQGDDKYDVIWILGCSAPWLIYDSNETVDNIYTSINNGGYLFFWDYDKFNDITAPINVQHRLDQLADQYDYNDSFINYFNTKFSIVREGIYVKN